MLVVTKSLPEDPAELRAFTALLVTEVKAQAVLIEKLLHQLAGARAHRFGTSSQTAEQLQLDFEMSEIAIAAITAKLRMAEDAPADKPKRKLITDHIPRVEVELTPGNAECAQRGGKLRRLGEDVTEELEYVPGRFIVNRIVRPRMACSGCDCFTQAPLPSIARQAIAEHSAEKGAACVGWPGHLCGRYPGRYAGPGHWKDPAGPAVGLRPG